MHLKSNLYNFQFKLRQHLLGYYYSLAKTSKAEIKPETFAPNKVLFVSAGLLGDSVMSIPAIIEARNLWQNSHFTVLGKKHNLELLSGCPLVDEFYECNADPFSLRKSNEIKGFQQWLDNENFDLAIILLGDQFAHLLAKAKIPVRVGVKETYLESCLTHTYDIGTPRTWGAAERLNAIRCLGYKVENTLPKLWVKTESRDASREKLSALGLKQNEKYVVLHPFGSTFRQWWNIENIVPLSNQLLADYNLRTVLIGGKETVPTTKDKVDDKIINTTGKLTLPELLSVVNDSDLVITTDSGPFHIAGALQKPIVGLFRSVRPEHGKQYPNTDIAFGKENLCQNLCKWDICRKSPCVQMGNISIQSVLHLTNQIL